MEKFIQQPTLFFLQKPTSSKLIFMKNRQKKLALVLISPVDILNWDHSPWEKKWLCPKHCINLCKIFLFRNCRIVSDNQQQSCSQCSGERSRAIMAFLLSPVLHRPVWIYLTCNWTLLNWFKIYPHDFGVLLAL